MRAWKDVPAKAIEVKARRFNLFEYFAGTVNERDGMIIIGDCSIFSKFRDMSISAVFQRVVKMSVRTLIAVCAR